MKRAHDLLGGFVLDLQAQVPVKGGPRPASVGDWAVGAPIRLDRGEFSFARHEYLVAPYVDDHPSQVEMKAAQMGNTTRALLRSMFVCLYLEIVGLLYLFPSRTGVSDFSRTRVAPLVDNNPDAIGQYVRDTDSIGLKRIKGVNFIMRGTKSEEGLRSDPCDFTLYDEYDLMPAGVRAVAQERMSHSDLCWEHILSNPTIPDFGVDREFQLTDQRYWLLKCRKCGKHTCLEDHIDKSGRPLCLAELRGQVVRLCMHCRDAALDPAQGEWVAKRPGVTDRRGYHYSQLFSQFPAAAPDKLLAEFETTRNLPAFFNYKLGLPYVEAENRLSVEEVLALCGTHGIASSDKGPCYMGVDQGSRLHVVIVKRSPDRVIHLGEYLAWEELDRLMEAFRVARAVVDWQPEKRPARAFAERHRGRVFLNYYHPNMKGACRWNEGNLTVDVDRTESLDASHSHLRKGGETLPRDCKPVREFAEHAHNTAKKLEDKDDGGKFYTWLKLGADHYRHAYNYAFMARGFGAQSYFGDCDMA